MLKYKGAIIDIKLYHALLRLLPRIIPRWAWGRVGNWLFNVYLFYTGKIRPFLSRKAMSERFTEYSWVLQALKQGGSILDVGCGDSLLDCELLRRGYRVCAIDLDRHPLPERHSDLHFMQGDITKAPFADSSFDQVVTISTMEHINDDVAAIRELSRIVKKGGLILITVPFGAFHEGYDAHSLKRLLIKGLGVLAEEYHWADGRKWVSLPKEEIGEKLKTVNNTKAIACLCLRKL